MPHKFIKKWVVDHVHDEYADRDIPVSVDPKAGGFWAEYPTGEEITADDVEDCKDAVLEAIRAHNALTWEPVILLNVNLGETRSWAQRINAPVPALVEIRKLQRAERATIAPEGGKMVERWRRFGGEDAHSHDHSAAAHWGDVVLPYTEELWARLQMIEESIRTANNRLADLLGAEDTPKGRVFHPQAIVDRVMALDTLLLAGPTQENEE